MAPPRGPRGASSTGREARPSTRGRTTRGGARGGIQKRRGALRTDVDGDLDMDAQNKAKKPVVDPSAPRRTTRSSTSTRGKLTARHAQTIARHLNGTNPSTLSSRISTGSGQIRSANDSLTWLRVKGLKESKAASNPGGGVQELIQFLERKATTLANRRTTRPVAIKKSRLSGDYVMIGATKEDADELIKLNKFTFASSSLEITLDSAEPSVDARNLKNQLQAFLSSRYLGDNKLLRLDGLSQDQAIIQAGFLETSERAEKMFKALMKVCDDLFKTRKEKQDAIESISVAHNNIDNAKQIMDLADTFPDLKNLDLRDNNISSTQYLQAFKNRFRMLQTIYIAGNPIETAQPDYQAHLLEWFPRLQDINGTKVRAPEQVAAAVEAAKPKPIPQGGPDFRDTNNIGENFIVDFFANYDNDRPGLVARYYDEASHFSLAVDVNSARDPNTPLPLPWAAYLKYSRNLTRITHLNTRVQRLFRGSNVIADLWSTLPRTKHPDLKQEMTKYIMDCHVLPGLADPNGQAVAGVDGMIITIHGEFDELDPRSGATGKRSFSRTFVLGPGNPNRNPIRVVSDMVSLRAWNPLPNIFANSNVTAGDAVPQRAAMVEELAKQTGMTPQFAELCLSDESVGWDFAKALIVFNEKRAQLPPEAFVATAVGMKA